jgi:hypothetical protein
MKSRVSRIRLIFFYDIPTGGAHCPAVLVAHAGQAVGRLPQAPAAEIKQQGKNENRAKGNGQGEKKMGHAGQFFQII